MGWKYVVLSDGMFELPIIFPDALIHADVAEVLKPKMPAAEKGRKWEVVSAGTIEMISATGVGGNSKTLNMKSRPDDAALILSYPYLHGIIGASMPQSVWKKLLED